MSFKVTPEDHRNYALTWCTLSAAAGAMVFGILKKVTSVLDDILVDVQLGTWLQLQLRNNEGHCWADGGCSDAFQPEFSHIEPL